ncbi:hypothetical protein [Pseudarthrobacter sp. TAF60_1]|uniref:hypothetical protein n=1 Tax=Pseudarthrobacter sp. TAF60_1 TaxID=3233071 RepID=UPI003F95A053
MESLKKIVSNQYFPAAAVLTAVVLFWTIAMFGGLSLLHNNQPPMATLTWMLFVYAAAVLTPLAGIIAAADLIRRWRRNRQYAQLEMAEYESAEYESAEYVAEFEVAQEQATETEPAADPQATPEASEQAEPKTSEQPAPAQPAPGQQRPATPQAATKQRPAQPKQRKTAA